MARTFTQVSPDSTGDKIAGQDIVDGADTVIRQEVLLADPTTLAGVAKVGNASPGSTDYGLVVRPAGDALVSLNAVAITSAAVLGTRQDTTGYGWFQLQLVGTFNATVVVEESNDDATWLQTAFYQVNTLLPTSILTSSSSPNGYWGYCKLRYMRVRCSSFTSNTSSAVTLVMRNTPPPTELINVGTVGSATILGSSGISGGAIRVVTDASSSSTNFSSVRIASAASTNATSVKGSAGNLYGGFLSNTSASAKFVKFYNKATAPTVGTDVPIWTCLVPAGQTISLKMDMNPLRFSIGIAYAITGAVADTDTTAVAANDVHGFLNYA